MGNLDPVRVVLFGAPDEVIAAGKVCIQKAGLNGRFILSPGCEVPRDTPYPNLEALIRCADEFGRYPIEQE
jgi:uroporphyrinogen decarboxylase